MTEAKLWQLVKGHWREYAHLVRVENAATFGTPDINCCCKGREWWIETKITKKGMTVIRPTQLAWMISRIKVNGNVFFLTEENGTISLYKSDVILIPDILKSINMVTHIDFKKAVPLRVLDHLSGWDEMLFNILELCRQKGE